MSVQIGPFSWERMSNAVEKVRRRLLMATKILESAGIPYAVADGNAFAAWVSRVDEAAVRNTQDVDILVRRDDLATARQAFESGGFVYRHIAGIDMFLDGPDAKARDAVHLIFAGEKVRMEQNFPNPDVGESESLGEFMVLKLESLVRVKLISYRDKDRTHLRDLIDVGLIDNKWPPRFPTELAARLQAVLDTPNG
jgi:hypothetical protein